MATIENPTSKKKAVRVPGGHAVIKPKESLKTEGRLTDEEVAKYEAAGLVIKGNQQKAQPAGK